jgi:hypothetical protein
MKSWEYSAISTSPSEPVLREHSAFIMLLLICDFFFYHNKSPKLDSLAKCSALTKIGLSRDRFTISGAFQNYGLQKGEEKKRQKYVD